MTNASPLPVQTLEASIQYMKMLTGFLKWPALFISHRKYYKNELQSKVFVDIFFSDTSYYSLPDTHTPNPVGGGIGFVIQHTQKMPGWLEFCRQALPLSINLVNTLDCHSKMNFCRKFHSSGTFLRRSACMFSFPLFLFPQFISLSLLPNNPGASATEVVGFSNTNFCLLSHIPLLLGLLPLSKRQALILVH